MMVGSTLKTSNAQLRHSWNELSDQPIFEATELVHELKKNLEQSSHFFSPEFMFETDPFQNDNASVELLVSQPVYNLHPFIPSSILLSGDEYHDSDLSVIDFDEAGSAVQFVCESPIRCASPGNSFDEESGQSSPSNFSPSEYYCPDLLSWEDDLFSAAISIPSPFCEPEDSHAVSFGRSRLVSSAPAEQTCSKSSDIDSDSDDLAPIVSRRSSPSSSSSSPKKHSTPIRHRSKSEQLSRANRKRPSASSASLASPSVPSSPFIASVKRRRRSGSHRKSAPSPSLIQNLDLQYAETFVQIVDSFSGDEDEDILAVSQPIAAFHSGLSSPFLCQQVVTLSHAASSTEDEDEDVDIL